MGRELPPVEDGRKDEGREEIRLIVVGDEMEGDKLWGIVDKVKRELLSMLCPCLKKFQSTEGVENLAYPQGQSLPVVRQPCEAPVIPAVDLAEIQGETVCALYDYTPMLPNELEFKQDDLLKIIGRFDEPWRMAVNTRTGRRGLIPHNYVTDDTTIAGALSAWYPVSRMEAEKRLLMPGIETGTYLIRPSRAPNTYALSMRTLSQGVVRIRHFKITRTADGTGFHMDWAIPFSSINDMLAYYSENPISDDCKITVPCARDRPQAPFHETELPRQSVQIIRLIDKGNFGEVWYGKIQSVEVAVKLALQTSCAEDLLCEARKMHAIWHPNLVQFYGVCTKPSTEPIYIITEFMAKGSLKTYLQSEEGRQLEEMDLVIIMDQVASGMVYLEGIQFVHRDLRAANVLVGKDRKVKVGDFGQSKMLSIPSFTPQDLKTPLRWSSPEALTNGTRVNSKSDVWQYGILGYEIFTYGGTPYEGYSREQIFAAICSAEILPKPQRCSMEVYELMKSCWKLDPEDRPDFKSLKTKLGEIMEGTYVSYASEWTTLKSGTHL